MKIIIIILGLLLLLNIWLYSLIFFPTHSNPTVYFLAVGQGDAELIILPGPRPAYILIDSGPDNSASIALNQILPPLSRRLDLALSTHADLDHIGGLLPILNHYRLGAFIWSGLNTNTSLWRNIIQTIQAKNINSISLNTGDSIHYGNSTLSILYPLASTVGQNSNITSLVTLLETDNAKFLFTGDIDIKTETKLLDANLLSDIDVLKVAHHGSKYGSSSSFLNTTQPAISIIEVGHNSYGHPTPETLNRLANINSQVFRTDEQGTVKIEVNQSQLLISSLK